jgi:hypothetical protein
MSNLTSGLPDYTCQIFSHAFMYLPWFCSNFEPEQYKVDQYGKVIPVLNSLTKKKSRVFGIWPDLKEANDKLEEFYATIKIAGSVEQNAEAVDHYRNAWELAWKNRKALELRGHEIKLMKYFYEIFSGDQHVHLPELLSMARVVDEDVVSIARLVGNAGSWTPKKGVKQRSEALKAISKKLFGRKKITPDLSNKVQENEPEGFKKYQQLVKDRKHCAQLRIIEIFDIEGWSTTIDSDTLRKRLKVEKLDDFLPEGFHGRVGVQPGGYPLTFHTSAGLELDKPPLNDVVINENYGKTEAGKEYKIHPVEDGTFYCETSAVVGDSKVKYYTKEYKRRARQLKYDKVATLSESIDSVRNKMLEDLWSDHRETWVRALIGLFIDSTCARIGNTVSTKGDKKTYGVTTLETKKHVTVKNGVITIRYKGKHGQDQEHTFKIYSKKKDIENHPVGAAIADRLMELINEKRQHLFTRSDGNPVAASAVNEYFTRGHCILSDDLPEGGAGAPCTVHNLRNYHATRIFKELGEKFTEKHKEAAYDEVLHYYQGCSETNNREKQIGMLKIICDQLGNTEGICRRAYIDPKEQLMFFRQWGYRPPEGLLKDVYVDEKAGTYGLDYSPIVNNSRYKFAAKRAKVARKRTRVKKSTTKSATSAA